MHWWIEKMNYKDDSMNICFFGKRIKTDRNIYILPIRNIIVRKQYILLTRKILFLWTLFVRKRIFLEYIFEYIFVLRKIPDGKPPAKIPNKIKNQRISRKIVCKFRALSFQLESYQKRRKGIKRKFLKKRKLKIRVKSKVFLE